MLLRKHLLSILTSLRLCVNRVKDVKEISKMPIQCAFDNTAITFIDDDQLLGSKPNSHPLFFTVYIIELKVNRIIMNGGSIINIIPKSKMNDLGISREELP